MRTRGRGRRYEDEERRERGNEGWKERENAGKKKKKKGERGKTLPTHPFYSSSTSSGMGCPRTICCLPSPFPRPAAPLAPPWVKHD